ncbi:MAG: hypothetical protein E6H09_10465 [Bacteroidetes bacterium]|jgi:hypothetical protein|nr:MAG: hypothetical protein E6H09_10465 [Bacteroidota bacterium]
MKLFYVALIIALLNGCKTKPFVKHDLQFEKVADNCNGMNMDFKMNSNLNGERYEFQRCLDADFAKEQLTSVQRGDTIELKFERKNSKQAVYKLTVDLDAYPRYNILIIDGTPIAIRPYEN